MNNYPKTVVIVDGYSTARELVGELNRLGAQCLHVRSVEIPPTRLSNAFSKEPYLKDYGYLGSCKEAAEMLAGLNIDAVIAGSEPGVEYAEELALAMGLPTNDPATAKARRNKRIMGETIASSGLLCASQQLVENEAEAISWATTVGSWPIVIKPLDSAGSDGVTICHSIDEIKLAVRRAMGKGNLLGFKNTALLAQTFLDGPQYFVNTVSVNGNHHVTDAWLMRGRSIHGFAYAMEDWLLADPDAPEIKEMFDYTLSAITALGFRNGAAVSEVRLTSKGPALIETGARLNGPTMERKPYLDAGLKGTQATALAEALVDPTAFKQRWNGPSAYKTRRGIAKSFFIFQGEGTICNVDGLADLTSLSSWHSMYRPLSAGDQVVQTVDTVGRGGVVYWVHDSMDTVQTDLAKFRDQDDQNRLYEVAYKKVA